MPSAMLKSVYAEMDRRPLPILVDLGYWRDPGAAARYDAMRSWGLSRRRFSFEGYGRVFLDAPPTKIAKIMAAFPIVEGSTYWRATHHWRGLAEGEAVAAIRPAEEP